jgi:hypothetical protein
MTKRSKHRVKNTPSGWLIPGEESGNARPHHTKTAKQVPNKVALPLEFSGIIISFLLSIPFGNNHDITGLYSCSNHYCDGLNGLAVFTALVGLGCLYDIAFRLTKSEATALLTTIVLGAGLVALGFFLSFIWYFQF